MKINSRRKGKAAEREVARLLEVWWGGVEPGIKFRSTPLSGGFSTPDVRGAFEMAGDLMTTAESFPYCVEVKHRQNWSEKTFVAGKKSPLWSWWKQAQKSALEENKIPLLIFRKNRMEWRVIIPEETMSRLSVCEPCHVWPEFKFDVGLHPVCYWAKDFLK